MILVDTSIWINHFRRAILTFGLALVDGHVGVHTFIFGELALGNLPRRSETLTLLENLPWLAPAGHDDVLAFVELHNLRGSGVGWVDAHLLCAANHAQWSVWSADRRLGAVAALIGIAVKYAGSIVSIPEFRFRQMASGVLFAETENVAVRVLDVEIDARPGFFLERPDHVGATRLQLAEQVPDTGHGDVRVQMLVLFPVRSVGDEFLCLFKVYRESVTCDARIERLVLEIELEAEAVTIVRNRSVEIVDEKLRGDPGNLRSTASRHWRHHHSSTGHRMRVS
jgi:predicted nucleic acid-binding protein